MKASAISRLSERQECIRRRLAGHGRQSVAALAGLLGVTPMTVRRDLAALERAGVLTRTHGGCVLHTPFVTDLSFGEKERTREAEKRAMAAEVVALLRPGESVYLDTGTTALQVARALPPGSGLRVFTNNLRIALELFGRDGVEVLVYGGTLAARNPDLVGEMAVAAAALFAVDVAVLGCDAVDVGRGELYAADVGSAALSRQVQRVAGRVVFMADHSKVGRRACAVVGRLGRGVTLVTDSGLSAAQQRRLLATRAAVVMARVEG